MNALRAKTTFGSRKTTKGSEGTTISSGIYLAEAGALCQLCGTKK